MDAGLDSTDCTLRLLSSSIIIHESLSFRVSDSFLEAGVFTFDVCVAEQSFEDDALSSLPGGSFLGVGGCRVSFRAFFNTSVSTAVRGVMRRSFSFNLDFRNGVPNSFWLGSKGSHPKSLKSVTSKGLESSVSVKNPRGGFGNVSDLVLGLLPSLLSISSSESLISISSTTLSAPSVDSVWGISLETFELPSVTPLSFLKEGFCPSFGLSS